MAHSSPDGIILGKGSTLQSLDLSINKEKVLSIKQQDKKLYSEEEVRKIVWESRKFFHEYKNTFFNKVRQVFYEWFEQFKKK